MQRRSREPYWADSALVGLLSFVLCGSLTLPVASAAAWQESNSGQAAAQDDFDWSQARRLQRKRQLGETLTDDELAILRRAQELRREQAQRLDAAGARQPRSSIGLTPLVDMGADDQYLGEDGGLYGGGQNEPPESLRMAAEREWTRIVPREENGQPNPRGTIGLISIGMSNATQEFSHFKKMADADPAKSPRVKIVDCAQGGQAMAEWVDPQGRAWLEADRRLRASRLSPQQVQVAWVKLANKNPIGDLNEHGQQLAEDTTAVVQNARARFPNLRIVYLSSRTYGGYSVGSLNPEPFAYEGGFVVRRLIQSQQAGQAALNWDSNRGEIRAPLLVWGPYLWADGVRPRKADGLTWQADDFSDAIHPNERGRQKVGDLMIDFFKNNALASPWFTGHR